MKKFLRHHPSVVIGALAIIFVAALFAAYSWAINDVFMALHTALATPRSESVSGFDLASASKLDLRGLVSSSSLSASAPQTASATASSTLPTP
ncbi:MAG TPA: hypothetical protein VMA75_01090 [Candidatus Paceibacterota bacterium]|nr:hypothetical protein [Candidatus Paceibacterota bacterium]